MPRRILCKVTLCRRHARVRPVRDFLHRSFVQFYRAKNVSSFRERVWLLEAIRVGHVCYSVIKIPMFLSDLFFHAASVAKITRDRQNCTRRFFGDNVPGNIL